MAVPLPSLQWFQDHTEPSYTMPHILLILILFFILLHFARTQATKSVNSPPSPPRLPIIGHLHLLGALPHHSLQALSQKYGPLMLLHFGSAPTLIISSAEMGREIMKTHDATFSNRPISAVAKAFVYGTKDMVFAPNGEYWRQMRKICFAGLLSVKRVQSFRFIRDDEIAKLVDTIKQVCSVRGEVNLSELIGQISNRIISTAVFGRSLEENEGIALLNDVMKFFAKFSVGDAFPSLGWVDVLTGLRGDMKKTSTAMHGFLDEVIDEHLMATRMNGEAERKDLVDLLLESQKDPTLGIEFTREGLRSVISDMFVAGTDTTFTVLEWTMAELVSHPDVLKKVQHEIRGVIGTKSNVDETDINQIDYLNCVIKETLRLHPPLVLSLPRVSTKSTTIDGYHIPAKTRALINIWAISRDPKVWDRPDEFIPERFLNNSVDFKGNNYEYTPFGAGRRSCPGLAFGVQSVESILANLLYWFDWEFKGGAEKMKIDMTEVFALSVHLKHPLRLVPKSHFSGS